MTERKQGRPENWRDGRLQGWRAGRLERLEDWRAGEVEGWGWRAGGRMVQWPRLCPEACVLSFNAQDADRGRSREDRVGVDRVGSGHA